MGEPNFEISVGEIKGRGNTAYDSNLVEGGEGGIGGNCDILLDVKD